MKTQILLVILAIAVLFSCSKKPQDIEQVVLAKIGDRTITLDEFIKRSEYTIRPAYAKGNHYIHKKIILNSLIAEKLFAFEAGKNNAMTNNPQFQNYIQGRKEQAMRKWLFRNEGTEKVQLKDEELEKEFFLSGREYSVAYFTVPTQEMADSVHFLLNQPNISFENVFKKIGGEGELPTHTVAWQREGNDAVIEALYTDSLKVGQVIGPIRAQNNVYTSIKILGWTESVLITDEQIRLRLRDVRERLSRSRAKQIYTDFILDVMRGKTVRFNQDTFFKVVEMVQPFYIVSQEEKQQMFNEKFWQEEQPNVNYSDMESDFESIKDLPLLTIDGQTWTVTDLRNELSRHPLVFRSRNVNNSNFPEQFKLAVVDLIRDKYLTEEAYKRGYDEINVIEQYTNMWQDQALALFHQQDYLRSQNCPYNFNKDYMKIIDQYLNSYVDSLQTKYSDQIGIDVDIFERVELTRIDMFVMENGVPYPIAVPGFPVVTTDNRLDYGSKLDEKQ